MERRGHQQRSATDLSLKCRHQEQLPGSQSESGTKFQSIEYDHLLDTSLRYFVFCDMFLKTLVSFVLERMK